MARKKKSKRQTAQQEAEVERQRVDSVARRIGDQQREHAKLEKNKANEPRCDASCAYEGNLLGKAEPPHECCPAQHQHQIDTADHSRAPGQTDNNRKHGKAGQARKGRGECDDCQ